MITIPKSTLQLLSKHSPPSNKVKYSYGTAGFRYHHELLPHIFIKMGILAALRSYSQHGQAVGLMCTASHNLEHDNGIKMADPDGGMLNSDIWEKYAVSLANAFEVEDVIQISKKLIAEELPKDCSVPMKVHFGRDTRSHSPFLMSLALAAAKSLHIGEQVVQIVDHGMVTTPQLHYFVMHANAHKLPNVIPFHYGKKGYFDLLCHSYLTLLNTKQEGSQIQSQRLWSVDCACGVGGYQIKSLQKKLNQLDFPSSANFGVVNGVNEGPLNDRCGAEYVQKQQLPPRIYSEDAETATKYHCSLDGDADRIVFHYSNSSSSSSSFHLLDGDKIAVLVATFVQNELTHLMKIVDGIELKCGVVQTAYANGASTDYLMKVTKTNVCIAKTGVKFVHEAAHTNYDIGIYFEANGHGTVVFGSRFYLLLSQMESEILLKHTSHEQKQVSPVFERARVAFQRLRVLPSLVNQAVGDAISDLLLVDAILYLKDWDLELWGGIYADLPSRQLKVKVNDRTLITTNGNETRVLSPSKLQMAIDQEVGFVKNSRGKARCFVRPSGTEDAVRVYAEASNQKDADELAQKASDLISIYCGVNYKTNLKIQSKL